MAIEQKNNAGEKWRSNNKKRRNCFIHCASCFRFSRFTTTTDPQLFSLMSDESSNVRYLTSQMRAQWMPMKKRCRVGGWAIKDGNQSMMGATSRNNKLISCFKIRTKWVKPFWSSLESSQCRRIPKTNDSRIRNLLLNS